MHEFGPQRLHSNCLPRSVVIEEEIPKRETHPVINARARVGAVIYRFGIASGHRVNWSMMVRRYEKPFEGGKGPTRSRWMISNRESGVANVASGVTVWQWVLDL